MVVKVAIILIPTNFDELVEFLEIVLRNFDHKTNAGVLADCFEQRLVVVRNGSCVSVDVQSVFSDGDWAAYDAKMIVKRLVASESDSPNRGAT